MFKNEFMAKMAFNSLQVIREYNEEDHIEKWELLNDERKSQVMKTVEAVLKNPNLTAVDMHYEWMKAKINDGWEYSPITNRDKKLHNCLVPFTELNIFQRMKDDIFIKIVKEISENIDYVRDDYDIHHLKK